MSTPLWTPSKEQLASSNLYRFMEAVRHQWQEPIDDYNALYRWSIECPEKFWQTLWTFSDVIGDMGSDPILLNGDKMPGAQWFPEARLNFAQNLLRRRDGATAIIFWGEDKVKRVLSHAWLWEQVAQVAKVLRKQGVTKGDRVVGYLPNIPETIVAALATASIGAIWSSCSPDFGVSGTLERFCQIEPKVLFCTNGYHYNGKSYSSQDKLPEIVAGLPTLKRVVIYSYLNEPLKKLKKSCSWDNFLRYEPKAATIQFEMLPFAYPLYILFSSGTTGPPKCIVHSAGGSLLQHLKEHLLHLDLRPEDRLFYFTTSSWMMWNWLVSALASEATLILYDGSPFYPDDTILFDYAEQEKITVFGTSAKYIDALNKKGAKPSETHDLTSLRTLLSTGSPLQPEGFDFVYQSIKQDICLSSISGGTDILSCFALGNPILPVWRGELQCRGLGMKVEIYNDSGKAIQGSKGELVCTAPFPSMPIGFWNDPDDEKYKKTYFDRFPNTWLQGDYAELTEQGGMVIYGRSDAVVNPGGVRIGTAEIYRQAERIDQVVESLAIGQQWQADVRLILFVRLRDKLVLDDHLIDKIKQTIRKNVSHRHVPAKIIQVADIPRTRSGKIVELAVRNIVEGEPLTNKSSIANPEALELYKNIPELQQD